MPVRLLDAARVSALTAATLTYPEVGTTRGAAFPPGYHHLRHSRFVPAGFAQARTDLLSWAVPRRAGLWVAASGPVVQVGAVVEIRVPLLPVRAACRVVWVIDEAGRCGFGYGTLPGHPESGEEAFLLERRADGRVEWTVRAFSRPGTTLTRLAGPAGRWVQAFYTRRYLRAFD